MASFKDSVVGNIFLLIIGAVISLTSSLATDYLHENRDEKKEDKKDKMEFNYDISKALGNRFYYTYDLLQQKGSKDTVLINNETEAYLKSREWWNENFYSYEAMLKTYYGDSIKNEFEKKVYTPLITIGHQVEDKKQQLKDTALVSQSIKIREDMMLFIGKIYNRAQKE